MVVRVLAIGIVVWAFAVAAQEMVREPGPYPPGQVLENPVPSDERSLAEGKRLYQAQCVTCHAENGAGEVMLFGELAVDPPNLTDDEWVYGGSDGEIFTLIQSGTPNDMQPFAGKLRDRHIWSIVNYLRTLAPAEPSAPETVGNPIAMSDESVGSGRQSYIRHCVECHGLDGRGHTEMVEFLLTKPADLTKDRWTYSTADPAVFGVIQNGTPNDMPPFGDKLDDEAIWNIVNYLKSIRD